MGNALNCLSAEAAVNSSREEQKRRKEDMLEPSLASPLSREFTESLRSDDGIEGSIITSRSKRETLPILNEGRPCSGSCRRFSNCLHDVAFSSIPFLLTSHVTNEELGPIRYSHNDLAEAQQHARECELPILCVEVEVPAGDKETGRDILSHPLVVEAAETLFLTVALPVEVTNPSTRYRPSKDRTPWYTKISFLDKEGNELVPAIGGDTLCMRNLVDNMVKSLRLTDKAIPPYLELLQEQETGKVLVLPNGVVKRMDRLATFSVSDCSVAEVDYADLEGVLAIYGGTYKGERVIQVTYDSKRLSYGALLRFTLGQHYDLVADTIYYQTQDERVAAHMEVGKMLENNKKPQIQKFDDEERIIPLHDPMAALRKN